MDDRYYNFTYNVKVKMDNEKKKKIMCKIKIVIYVVSLFLILTLPLTHKILFIIFEYITGNTDSVQYDGQITFLGNIILACIFAIIMLLLF